MRLVPIVQYFMIPFSLCSSAVCWCLQRSVSVSGESPANLFHRFEIFCRFFPFFLLLSMIRSATPPANDRVTVWKLFLRRLSLGVNICLSTLSHSSPEPWEFDTYFFSSVSFREARQCINLPHVSLSVDLIILFSS